MRLLLFSDSHGSIHHLQTMMSRTQREGTVDAILFAGDGIGDLAYLQASCPVYAVCGNCDLGSSREEELLLNWGSHQVYLTHGHRHRVKHGLSLLTSDARERGANIAVFGHSHKQGATMKDGILCMNPGALSKGEYAILIMDNDAQLKRIFFQL